MNRRELEILQAAQLAVFEELCSIRQRFVKRAEAAGPERGGLEAFDELSALVAANLAHTEARLRALKQEAAKAQAQGFSEEDADIIAGIAALSGLIH